MTPDDKRRLAEIDEHGLLFDDVVPSSVALDLRRMLDEAIAREDAAMAALREPPMELRKTVAHVAVDNGLDSQFPLISASQILRAAHDWIAAHSAATKPAEEVSG